MNQSYIQQKTQWNTKIWQNEPNSSWNIKTWHYTENKALQRKQTKYIVQEQIEPFEWKRRQTESNLLRNTKMMHFTPRQEDVTNWFYCEILKSNWGITNQTENCHEKYTHETRADLARYCSRCTWYTRGNIGIKKGIPHMSSKWVI